MIPLATLIVTMSALAAPAPARDSAPPFIARRIADGVYVVPGNTGRGSEGRPNAGFIVTREGVIVVDALASPARARPSSGRSARSRGSR